MSVSSVQTNSQLPVACTDRNNSTSVDGPRSHHVDISSASCSPWQSGHGPGGSRAETAVKSACESNPAGISLHSDAAAEHHIRRLEPQMPCYVGNSTVGDGEDIVNLCSDVNLRSDFTAGSDSRNGSRLSHGVAASTAAAAVRIRSSAPQMPCYIGNSTIGDGEDIVNLRSDVTGTGTTDSRNVVGGSRLSHDGIVGPMTDVDATPEQDQTSAQPG